MKAIIAAFSGLVGIFLLHGCTGNSASLLNDNPKYLLTKHIASGDSNVLKDVALFLRNKPKYAEKYRDNLAYHGYEAAFANAFDFPFVLTESLKLHHKAVAVDWRADPLAVLTLVDQISAHRLSACHQFDALKQRFTQSEFNISHFLEIDTSAPSILSCAEHVGLKIIAIDDGTDAWVLTLVALEDAVEVENYALKVHKETHNTFIRVL